MSRKTLPPDSPIFGINVPASARGEIFRSRLPPAYAHMAAVTSPTVNAILKTGIPLGQMLNFSAQARDSVYFTATRIGAFEQRYRDLERLFDGNFDQRDVETLYNTAEQVTEFVSGFSNALTSVASVVPIVGAVVQFGTFIVETILNSLQKPEVYARKALVYDKGTDEQVTNVLMGIARQEDLTNFFLPMFTGGWRSEPIDYGGGNVGRFISNGPQVLFTGDMGPSRGGFAPNIPDMLTDWQFPNRVVGGSTREAGRGSFSGGTLLFPSAVQLGMLQSSRIMKYGIEMFSINGEKIVSGWEDYFAGMDELRARTEYRVLKRQLVYISSFCTTDGQWKRYAKYGPNTLPSGFERVQTTDPYDGQEYLRMDGLIKWLVYKKWQDRARDCLDTLWCAYISPDAPAFKGNPMLKAWHEDRRRQLLKHQARWKVDLDMIPDQEYRAAMYRATMDVGSQGGFRITPGTGSSGVTKKPLEAMEFEVDMSSLDPLPSDPDESAAPSPPAGVSEESVKNWHVALALAVLGAGGYALWRK